MNLCITTEALNQRFNSSAVQLLQRIFLNLFQLQTKKIFRFSRIITSFHTYFNLRFDFFQLSNTYESTYKGHGGGAKKVHVKYTWNTMLFREIFYH